MWYLIIILSFICVGFFMWVRADYKKKKRELNKSKNRPPFRTEDVLEEYGKPLKDKDQQSVDFDDA